MYNLLQPSSGALSGLRYSYLSASKTYRSAWKSKEPDARCQIKEEIEMDCPRCNVALSTANHKGIEVDRCSQCEGLWLDHPELDQLEDTVMDDDPAKGTMLYALRDSDITCPKCARPMKTFNYHAYNLPIDACENDHGFWLDKGEEERVLELMKQRIKDLKRSGAAEEEWGRLLGRLKSRSFADKIKGLFR